MLSRLALWIPGFASCVVWQYTREKNLSILTKFSCASFGTQQPKALDARESVIACRKLTIQRQLCAGPIQVVAVAEKYVIAIVTWLTLTFLLTGTRRMVVSHGRSTRLVNVLFSTASAVSVRDLESRAKFRFCHAVAEGNLGPVPRYVFIFHVVPRVACTQTAVAQGVAGDARAPRPVPDFAQVAL